MCALLLDSGTSEITHEQRGNSIMVSTTKNGDETAEASWDNEAYLTDSTVSATKKDGETVQASWEKEAFLRNFSASPADGGK